MCIASTELIKVLTQIYNMQYLYNEHISGFCSSLQRQFLGDNQSSGGDPTLSLFIGLANAFQIDFYRKVNRKPSKCITQWHGIHVNC